VLSFSDTLDCHVGAASRFLQLANPSFDVSLYEIWIPWSWSFALISCKTELILRNIEFGVNSLRITHLGLTPALASLARRHNMPTVKALLCGGEALPQSVLDEWGGDNCSLYNCYGPSECTVNALVNVSIPQNTKSSIIGRPQPTCSIFVMSNSMHPVVKGAVGELCIGGPQVSPGYWKQKELSEEKFPTISVTNKPHRIFKTGDMVRMMPDGTIDYIRRLDDQVKRNGLRIELGEINTVLAKSNVKIMEVISLILKHPSQERSQLVSFVVLRKEQGRSTTNSLELIPLDHASATTVSASLLEASNALPIYMQPTHIFIIEYLPINASGKVDRKLLSKLYMEKVDITMVQTTDAHSEWTDEETTIQLAVAEVSKLAKDTIKKETNLFQVGLDSISAIRLSSKLNAVGMIISVSEIMRNPTISKLAMVVKTKAELTKVGDSKSIKQLQPNYLEIVRDSLGYNQEIDAAYRCTPLQERMLARTFASDNDLYMHSLIFKLHQTTDAVRLLKSWEMVVQANETLRSGFLSFESNFIQIVHSLKSIKIIDLDVTSVADIGPAVKSYMSNVKSLLMLGNPPIQLLRMSMGAQIWIAVILHHALYDGVSLQMMLDDVSEAYVLGQANARPKFSDLATFIVSQSEDSDKMYWNGLLDGASVTTFPCLTDKNMLSDVSHGAEVKSSISVSLLKEVCAKLEVSNQSVFQAGWCVLLSLYTGQADVIFGSIVSGRSCPVAEVGNIMGPAFNTVPVRVNIEKLKSCRDLIVTVHTQNLETLDHQFTPLRSIMKWADVNSSLSLFDTLFLVQRGDTKAPHGLWDIVDDESLELDVSLT
jgi:aryl carrier-like protein/uncharacterized protein YqgV (UPF0045/DUF77 family)